MSQFQKQTFSIAYNLDGDAPLTSQVFSQIAAAGFDEACISISDAGPIAASASDAELSRIAAEASAAGLSLVLSCDRDNLASLTANDPKTRTPGIESVVALLDKAVLLSACNVVINPAPQARHAATNSGRTYADDAAGLLDSLLALRFEAELRGVTLSCRAISNGLLLSPVEARRFVDRVSLPFIGLSLEACVSPHQPDFAEYIRILTHRISHVRIGTRALTADSAKSNAPSANDIDIVRALREIGCEGCLDVSAGATPGEAMDYLQSVMTAMESRD